MPPGELQASVAHEKDFNVNMTKAQSERFPALDEKVLDEKQKSEDYDTPVSQFVDSGTINQEAARYEYSPVQLPKPNYPKPQHDL